MKLLPTLIFAGLVLSTPSLFAAGESLQQILSDAQDAMHRGDLVTAKKDFDIVAQLDPKNQVAQNYLRILRQQLANAPKGNAIEKQLNTVILPKLEFKEATPEGAFEFLRQQVPKVTGGKTSVNFVIQLPDQVLHAQIVTLTLTNIPFPVALKYVCDIADLQFEYEQYAIKITPKGGAVKSTASPLPPGSDTPTAPATSNIPGLPR